LLYNIDNLFIIQTKTNQTVKCDITLITKDLAPRKRDGWSFNWIKAYKETPQSIFALIETTNERVHGVVQLINDDGMLIMQLLELAPYNIGAKKEYSNVAGILIAFACKQAFKLETNYQGYLTFVSKTKLVELYKTKYLATQTIGNRMYIDPIAGNKLINKYLENEK